MFINCIKDGSHCVVTSNDDNIGSSISSFTISKAPHDASHQFISSFCPGSAEKCAGKTCVKLMPQYLKDFEVCSDSQGYAVVRSDQSSMKRVCYSRNGKHGSWTVENLCSHEEVYNYFSGECVPHEKGTIEG